MTQAPISVTVNSATVPVRAGMPNTPYLIINTSASSTVWVSPDPGVASGVGMQIPAGSKLHRQGGEVYCVLDSAAKTPATLVFDATSNDWGGNPAAIAAALLNSGTLLVDSPVQLANQGFNGATSYHVGPIDVSTYQSIMIRILKQATPNHTFTVHFNWSDSVNVMATDTFAWSSTDIAPYITSLPCRGSQLDIVLLSSPAQIGAGDAIMILGSHRPFNEYMRMPAGLAQGTVQSPLTDGDRTIHFASGTVGANSFITNASPLVRYDGPAFITCSDGSGANGPMRVEITDLVNTGNPLIFAATSGTPPTTGINYVQGSFVLPRNSYQVALANDGAAGPINYRFAIVAAPDL